MSARTGWPGRSRTGVKATVELIPELGELLQPRPNDGTAVAWGVTADGVEGFASVHRDDSEAATRASAWKGGQVVPLYTRQAAEPAMAAVAAWMVNGRTGASSKTMAAWLGFRIKPDHVNWPRDAGDFGRCMGLLDAAPEIRGLLSHLADLGPEWSEIAGCWHQIEAEYRAGRMTAASELVAAAIAAARNIEP